MSPLFRRAGLPEDCTFLFDEAPSGDLYTPVEDRPSEKPKPKGVVGTATVSDPAVPSTPDTKES